MAKWLLLLSMLIARPVFAGDGLDVRDWLARPGVKLLAVEFYASWCAPCKKAVPQWKTLHEKYRDQGLRLVVVSVQDPDGACVNPGWNPDDVVCDTEGRLAEAWGVGDRLPAAFLWSWRGPLLVRKGHVQEVGRAVEEELGRLPRVTLDEGMDGHVRELLRTELARTGKVDVVAGAEEEEALAAIRRKSHELQFSDRSACKLGQRLAANSLLKTSFVPAGNGKRLLVQLFSAETGCLNASAGVFWNLERPELSVAEAVAELVNNLRVSPELPGSAAPAAVKEREIGERAEGWELEGTSGVVVVFETEPAGAVVLLDGKVLCQSTPCSKLVAPGSHKVEFQLESYLPERESLTVSERTGSVKRTLTPDFGWLTVRSQPAGLDVTLDGKPLGTTPVARRQVSSGPHRVLVSDPRYFDKGKEIVVDRGEHEEVEVELTAREGGIKVLARDAGGNDLIAEVSVDGEFVGKTPYLGKVLVGTHEVTVTLDDLGSEHRVEVLEQQVVKVEAELVRGSGQTDTAVKRIPEPGGSVPCPGCLKTKDERGLVWARIPGGQFRMGCSLGDDDCGRDEEPAHAVTVADFQMMANEVTQEQYETILLEDSPSHATGCRHCPVTSILPGQAETFCEAVGGRLPTEAEWEYAARAGSIDRYGGIAQNDLGNVAWYAVNSTEAKPVMGKESNAYGLYDMLGNVQEWVQDCSHSTFDGAPISGYPPWVDNCMFGGGLDLERVLRGGSFKYPAEGIRVSSRKQGMDLSMNRGATSRGSSLWFDDVGFRCVKAIGSETSAGPPGQDSEGSTGYGSWGEDPEPGWHEGDTLPVNSDPHRATLTERQVGEDVGLVWVPIPEGRFQMGCEGRSGGCEPDAQPAHAVRVTAFEMLETEVTNAQWEAVTGKKPACWHSHDTSSTPVACVSWQEGKSFCQAVGGRLPTEAEWEYAARAGSTSRFYCGDAVTCLGDWMLGVVQKVEARSGKPNAFGLYHMLANVYEWVEDCPHPNYSEAPDTAYPAWDSGCSLSWDRMIRGSSFVSSGSERAVWYRRDYNAASGEIWIGIRCARSGD